MSATGNQIQMQFNIGSESLIKLEKIMSGKGGSSSNSGGAGGLGKGLAGMQKMGMGGIAKLAGIAGGITILVGLIKKITALIFDSSPMLKQIMTLMNFGLMLIFRPIGDFIGFMLRPIVVLLLRQVIIPFYRDVLPIAREFGDLLGGGLVELWEDPSTFIADAINATGAWAQEQVLSMLDGTFDWEGFGIAVLDGALKFIKALPLYQIEKLIFEVLQKIDWSGATKGLETIGAAFSKAVGDRFHSVSTMIQQPFLMFIGKINTLLLVTLPAEIAKFQQTISNIWIQIQQPFLLLIGKFNMFFLVTIPNFFKNIKFPDIGELIRAGATDAWGGFTGALGFAEGGQINEPIFGIGKSGQTYTFGERGSETIIPNGGSSGGEGITVNISVGNIASEGDMANFERRVTEVLESVNSRRGRT